MACKSVVSLLPAATELLYELGVEPAAVSSACDYPPAARGKPVASTSQIDNVDSSREIHRRVSDAVTENEGVYSIDQSVLGETDPDVIITQGLCEVCAVDHSHVTTIVSELDLDVRIISCHPHTLEDILESIHTIGTAIGRESTAQALIQSYRSWINNVRSASGSSHPSVVVFVWMDPVMIAGHWVPDLVQIAGGQSELVSPGEHSGPCEWRAIRACDPDVIIVAPCGFSMSQTATNITDLVDREGWESLEAVQDNRVYFLDGNRYVNRPGPRIFDTLEIIAEILHPSELDASPEEYVPLDALLADR